MTVEPSEGVTRRIDIADEDQQIAIEYKTGYQTADQYNLWEVQRDANLVKQGWDVRWVFDGKASAQLKKALDDAKITYTGGD